MEYPAPAGPPPEPSHEAISAVFRAFFDWHRLAAPLRYRPSAMNTTNPKAESQNPNGPTPRERAGRSERGEGTMFTTNQNATRKNRFSTLTVLAALVVTTSSLALAGTRNNNDASQKVRGGGNAFGHSSDYTVKLPR